MHIILKLAPLTLAMITTSAAQADFTSKKAMTAAHIPQKIQRLIHKEEILDDRCRSPGMDANGRICSARVDADRHLIHLGWCWGTEKRDTVEADSYWLRCSRVWTRK